MNNPRPHGKLLLALAILLSAGIAESRPRARRTPPSRRPALAVIVAVDGLSWERLSFYRPWYVAGLKRLLDEGRLETACRYRHINTETGPGHASLATGVPPRLHGIVTNSWYERAPDGAMRNANCTDEVGADGTVLRGADHLRVPTLGDRLRATYSGSRVVSLSAKDRSAIFLAGRDRQHTAYWYDKDAGIFVTSPRYDPPASSVRVVEDFNGSRAGAALLERFGPVWKQLPVPEADASAPRPTAVPAARMIDFQLPTHGLGWDHLLVSSSRSYFDALYYSPFVDTMIADLAIAFVESEAMALGRGATPDLLALSFSAQDTVSHSYGAESEENLDVLRRLDLEVGRVLDAFDRRMPSGSVVLALSADHGFPRIPEAEKARTPGFRGGRLTYGRRVMTSFVERLGRRLAEELCAPAESRILIGSDGWSISYNHAVFPLKTVEGCGAAGESIGAKDVDRVFPGVVRLLFAEEVESVWLKSEHERWPVDDPAAEYVRNDFDRERSGDAILIPRPGVMIHWDPGRGAMHGTHFDHDAHVPLVFWGAPFPKGEIASDSTPYDLAPTLAPLLGVDLPAVGRNRLDTPAPSGADKR